MVGTAGVGKKSDKKKIADSRREEAPIAAGLIARRTKRLREPDETVRTYREPVICLVRPCPCVVLCWCGFGVRWVVGWATRAELSATSTTGPSHHLLRSDNSSSCETGYDGQTSGYQKSGGRWRHRCVGGGWGDGRTHAVTPVLPLSGDGHVYTPYSFFACLQDFVTIFGNFKFSNITNWYAALLYCYRAVPGPGCRILCCRVMSPTALFVSFVHFFFRS